MRGTLKEQRAGLLNVCATEDALWGWVRWFLGLSVPRRAVCPGHDAPLEYLKAAYFEPASDLVVWAPRGGGKTRLGAAATLLDLLHKPGVRCASSADRSSRAIACGNTCSPMRSAWRRR